MALTDDRGVRPARGGPEFDRQPPQDITAEQSVLGGMLLSKDAIADVIEVLRPNDFYRPAHEVVYECVLDLYGRGEPADPITVSAELERRGELLRIGGAPYLHTLIATVPTAANAGYYAEIVADKAILRRLVEAGTRIVQLGYHGADGADVDEVVDRAQAAVYEVTERRTAEDYAALEDLLQPTMDELEAIETRGLSFGVPTGFEDLDAVTNGLHPGQMIIIAARPGIGKALALDTPLPTPLGWTTMGEVAAGDRLIGADGGPVTVVGVSDVMLGRPCYEVELSDGFVIVADGGHQWLTSARQPGVAGASGVAVRTTEELAATLRCGPDGSRPNHSVANCAPLRLPEPDLAVPPYVLGAWLGAGRDGLAAVLAGSPEIAAWVCGDDPLGAAPDRLGVLGLLDDPHVPAVYLRASETARRSLLAGLLDVAGMVVPGGGVRVTAGGERLARDVHELVVSLGYRCSVAGRRVTFLAGDDVFRLHDKQLMHKRLRPDPGAASVTSRFVVGVRRVPSVAVRCVEVDAADHLYLAGRSMVPTHNSTLGLDFARSCSIRHSLTSVVFSLEMSRTEIVMRLLSAEAGIPLADMRTGRMNDDKWAKLARKMSEISEAPLFIDDSPNMTMMEIRAKARRLKQRHGLRLIVVDYMQLMTSGKRVESRQQEVSEFSRQLKLLAKELEVPVVTISQLNRGPEQRTDKKPMLGDLRESGCLTASTRVLRADTGTEVTLGELMISGEVGLPVWSLDERLRLVARPMMAVFSSGVKEVFRLRLASGREVEASANHPFLTAEGWVPLGELGAGDLLAVPRLVPEPLDPLPMPESQVVQLGNLLGGGSSGRHPVQLAHGGCNPTAAWLDGLGLSGVGDDKMFVPACVFSLPKEQLALFLRHLWAAGGSVRWDELAGKDRSYYAATSRRLIDDVAQLLLRFGVLTRIERVVGPGCSDSWHLHLDGAENQRRFLDEVGADGGPDSLTVNGVCWDEIVEVASLGERPVYDATVPGTQNFVANGIAVHNSLEQDADMVLLIHRPDAFERDDPRAGEADVIIAKHRNGPTATITVTNQLHLSRFANFARA